MEEEKGNSNGAKEFCEAFGKAFKEMTETNIRIRKEEREENEAKMLLYAKSHDENIKTLTEKLEALHTTQISSFEAQRQAIRTPLPKYGGNPGEFEDWRTNLMVCIKNNGWTNDARVLELLPGALVGEAYRTFQSLTGPDRSSLGSALSALKNSLDPNSKSHNRELFIKAKRNPGESMRTR